jgi:hypothetical protein
MEQWDRWQKYIAEGGTASWPRDAFEALLDHFSEKMTGWSGYAWKNGEYIDNIQEFFDDLEEEQTS